MLARPLLFFRSSIRGFSLRKSCFQGNWQDFC
jgi:hypothetical protein